MLTPCGVDDADGRAREDRESGDTVGTLTVTGPLGATTVDVSLAGDIEPPSGWWRLGHPLELFGLAG